MEYLTPLVRVKVAELTESTDGSATLPCPCGFYPPVTPCNSTPPLRGVYPAGKLPEWGNGLGPGSVMDAWMPRAEGEVDGIIAGEGKGI